MDCTPARELPEGRHLVRVLPQSLHAEVGSEVACWAVPSGWYYTDAGRARISAAVDVWQKRLEDVELKLSALKAPAPLAAPPRPEPASAGWALLSALALGFLLGFALGRLRLTTPKR